MNKSRMKKTGLFSSFAAILLLSLFWYMSNDQIYHRVISGSGYRLSVLSKPYPVELTIDPAWLKEANKEKVLNKKLVTLENTAIFLDRIDERGNDISFSFSSKPDMDYKRGKFLYNAIIGVEKNISTTYFPPNILILKNSKGQEIEIGQQGAGSGNFGFGIDPADRELIKDGFTVYYNGFILYGYEKEPWLK